VNSVRERNFRRSVAVFFQYCIPCVAGRRRGSQESIGRAGFRKPVHSREGWKEYIESWYATVSMGRKLILPYHYISNTDYPVDKVDEWIKMNVQLIDESSKVVENGKQKYAMISIGLGHLVFQSDKILSFFVHADVNGFIVQVSDMKQLNEQSLGSYLEFVLNLQKYTNKPVIALKVPIPLGFALIAKGVHGFSLGLASIDYFDEQYIKEEKDSSLDGEIKIDIEF
jgi:hypothetical protein